MHSGFSNTSDRFGKFPFFPKAETCCCLSGRERKKHLKREIILWCQQGASFNFFSSFFKLIFQGYTAWAHSDLLLEIPYFSTQKSILTSQSLLISHCNTLMLLYSTTFPAKLFCHIADGVNKKGAVNRWLPTPAENIGNPTISL